MRRIAKGRETISRKTRIAFAEWVPFPSQRFALLGRE
jgi:hypothetical protein